MTTFTCEWVQIRSFNHIDFTLIFDTWPIRAVHKSATDQLVTIINATNDLIDQLYVGSCNSIDLRLVVWQITQRQAVSILVFLKVSVHNSCDVPSLAKQPKSNL